MSEVQFNGLKGNYSYYKQEESTDAAAVKENQEKAATSAEAKSADPNKVMDALAYMGVQNLVNVSGKLPVNPSDYLSDESIASIEESMAKFEEGVNIYADAIKAEFGNLFSEDQIMALAANAFSLE